MSSRRDEWPERWERGATYRDLAAEAGISHQAVSGWFRQRGYYRRDSGIDGQAEPIRPYWEYPEPIRALILFYPEGDPRRLWMETQVAAWWAKRYVSVRGSQR